MLAKSNTTALNFRQLKETNEQLSILEQLRELKLISVIFRARPENEILKKAQRVQILDRMHSTSTHLAGVVFHISP